MSKKATQPQLNASSEWRSDPDAETILRDVASLPFTVETINLSQIDWSSSANNCARMSSPLNHEKIEDYMTCMHRGDQFPRPVVELTKKNTYTILGGNQRLSAKKRLDASAYIECYVVDPMTSGERELVIRSLNSRHGWGSTKEERIQHAVYLVRKFGMHTETVAKAMVVSSTTITMHIRAEDERSSLARKGVDASGVSLGAFSAISSISDDSLKLRVADLAASKLATGENIASLVAAVTKAPSKAKANAAIAEFSTNLDALAEIKGKSKGRSLKKPRREKFLRLINELSQFLDSGNDGSSFSTLDELSCTVTHDLDNVRVLAAKINSRLQCICESGK